MFDLCKTWRLFVTLFACFGPFVVLRLCSVGPVGLVIVVHHENMPL